MYAWPCALHERLEAALFRTHAPNRDLHSIHSGMITISPKDLSSRRGKASTSAMPFTPKTTGRPLAPISAPLFMR
jgi:hypothetical protein